MSFRKDLVSPPNVDKKPSWFKILELNTINIEKSNTNLMNLFLMSLNVIIWNGTLNINYQCY